MKQHMRDLNVQVNAWKMEFVHHLQKHVISRFIVMARITFQMPLAHNFSTTIVVKMAAHANYNIKT